MIISRSKSILLSLQVMWELHSKTNHVFSAEFSMWNPPISSWVISSKWIEEIPYRSLLSLYFSHFWLSKWFSETVFTLSWTHFFSWETRWTVVSLSVCLSYSLDVYPMNIDQELNTLFNSFSPNELRQSLTDLLNQHSSIYSSFFQDEDIPDDFAKMTECNMTLLKFLSDVENKHITHMKSLECSWFLNLWSLFDDCISSFWHPHSLRRNHLHLFP